MDELIAAQSARPSATSIASTSTTYGGVVAATLTPCRQPGEPDIPGMQRLARKLVEHGCDGLFVIGSTGELPMLDDADRRALIAAARAGAGERTVVYAGISGLGVKQALRHAQHAHRDGADVAIVMAPFFLKLSQDELQAYVTAIADDSALPVGIYHHLRMPSEFGIDTVGHLARHPNIVVMKDTSVDVERMQQLVRATAGSNLALFQGSEFIVHPSLQSGAHGCVTALAGIAPEWHRGLIDAHQAGQHERAALLQQRIAHLAELFQLKQVKCSFAHFAYTLRSAAQQRGWIDAPYGMIPGFTPEPAFERAIIDHLKATQLI